MRPSIRPSEVFPTDEEFERLLGTEIAGLIRALNEASKQKCPECGGICCREAGCLLYSPAFHGCPIYEIRPRECRYHFCHRILSEAPLDKEQKDLLMRPITEFTRGNRGEIAKMFPTFPTFPPSEEGLTSLRIRDTVVQVVRSFEQGELTQEAAQSLLKKACRHL